MPSLAILSMRGVGIVPPYAPKAPQPTLSTRMNTMFGFPVIGTGLVPCAWANPTSPAMANATRAADLIESDMFIFFWLSFNGFKIRLLANEHGDGTRRANLRVPRASKTYQTSNFERNCQNLHKETE